MKTNLKQADKKLPNFQESKTKVKLILLTLHCNFVNNNYNKRLIDVVCTNCGCQWLQNGRLNFFNHAQLHI